MKALQCGCPANGHGHAAWCVRNASANPRARRTGPGSAEDVARAVETLEALMLHRYPQATSYSQGMILIARDLLASEEVAKRSRRQLDLEGAPR